MNSYGAIIGYPRSGNNWLRFIIEYLTDHQTGFQPLNTEMRRPLHHISELIDSKNKRNNEIIWNTHFLPPQSNLNEIVKNKGKIILILRNYKECIVRHIVHPKGLGKDGFIKNENFPNLINENENYLELIHYLKLIDFYDKYEGEKEVIYYEDLLNKDTIRKPLEKLISLLDGDKEKIEPFIKSFEFLVNESKNFYKRLGGSKSPKGTKLHHSKCLSLEQKKHLDDTTLEMYPHLEKYIKKYYDKI